MLAYTRTGSGTPLVLLHAFPLSSAMWAGQRGGLGRECEVITPDQRGFGDSAGALDAADPNLDHLVDDLAAVLDHLELPKIVLGGLSMGGYVAMAFQRRHPGRARGLILANTKASADTFEAAANRLRIASEVETAGSSQPLLDTVAPKLLGERTRQARAELVGAVERMVLEAPPRAVAWAQRAMAARRESFDVLASLTIPVLVIAGEADALMSAADADAMVSAAPQAELVNIAGVGHLSAMEAPADFNAAVSGFMKQL